MIIDTSELDVMVACFPSTASSGAVSKDFSSVAAGRWLIRVRSEVVLALAGVSDDRLAEYAEDGSTDFDGSF